MVTYKKVRGIDGRNVTQLREGDGGAGWWGAEERTEMSITANHSVELMTEAADNHLPWDFVLFCFV